MDIRLKIEDGSLVVELVEVDEEGRGSVIASDSLSLSALGAAIKTAEYFADFAKKMPPPPRVKT